MQEKKTYGICKKFSSFSKSLNLEIDESSKKKYLVCKNILDIYVIQNTNKSGIFNYF